MPPRVTIAMPAFNEERYIEACIESVQAQGQNINIYPEVAGPITRVLVAEGAKVHKGDLLLTIDDSVQRATTEQQQSQADAAKALLEELQAEPRRETLAVATAQIDNALATRTPKTSWPSRSNHTPSKPNR